MKAVVAITGPKRTCISCRETGRKEELLRLVGEDVHVSVDPLRGTQGRARYVHVTKQCLEESVKRFRHTQTLQEFLSKIRFALEKQLEQDMNSARRFGWMDSSGNQRAVNRVTRRIQKLQTWTKQFASTATGGC